MERKVGRFKFIGVFFSLIGLAIVFQMVRIQNMPASKAILDVAQNYMGVNQVIYPDRGNIYDVNGDLLAGNEIIYEVGIDLPSVLQPETIAKVAADVLKLDYGKTLQYASIDPNAKDSPQYITLSGFATKDDIRQLEIIEQDYKTRDLAKGEIRPRLEGLMWTPHNKRSYPEGDLASNILGFYSYLDRTKGSGFFGVEENYNQLLAGTPKAVYTEFDPQKVQNLLEVPPGADLVLTINKEIQAMVEKQLDDAIRWSEAKSGTILVYNPKNGEVLAMATTPRLDPNQYWNYADVFPGTTPFNRAISQTYESGSVFKVITMASALDAGAVTPQTTFMDTGGYDIGGYTINNWDYGAWGLQDMTGCLQHSLNVCLTWIAVQLGADRFYDYIKAFGFDRNTGIDLAGEQHWPLKLPGDNQWYEVDLATNSFGQGISVTPIQMAMAIGAVANEGKMYAPHLVKSLMIDGKQMDIKPVLVGNPIKAETARTLTDMLVNSLQNEASDALVEGYTLAGKTGTGSIPTEFGYTLSETNASFVGWGPADDPQFLVYVWLERPGISQWASLVAAPVFSKIVSNLVVLMGIPPDAIRAQINGQNSASSLGE